MEVYSPEDLQLFKKKAIKWAASFETACCFDSNGYSDPYSAFDVLIAAGSVSEVIANTGKAFEELENYCSQKDQYLLGFLSYDLKNETEDLSSLNPDHLEFPDLYFFQPANLLRIRNNAVEIIFAESSDILTQIENINLDEEKPCFIGEVQNRFTPSEYQESVYKLKEHIQRGDVYEVTFCQEFYSEKCILDPINAFYKLSKISPTPFSSFLKYNSKYIISASPERFLSKRGNKVISQPIKGTLKRSKDLLMDEKLKIQFQNDPKELAENVMIVDLVRNDLTRCAVPGTVKVEELCGVYTFEHVHQMISTITCTVDPKLSNPAIIKSTFPMGSMTGAPKFSSMQLIEKYERSKRGIFSGAIGYFAPNGDFDFNVVIRTILYNENKKYLSYHVGSAITFSSDPKDEYEECLLKAEAIRKTLAL